MTPEINQNVVTLAEFESMRQRLGQLEQVVKNLLDAFSDMSMRDISKAITDLNRIVNGDESLNVKPLRDLYLELNTRLESIEQSIGKANWILTGVASLAGVPAAKILWDMVVWFMGNQVG